MQKSKGLVIHHNNRNIYVERTTVSSYTLLFPLLAPVLNSKSNHPSSPTNSNTGYCWAFHFHNTVLLISLSQHPFTDFTFTTLFYCFHFHSTVWLLSLSQHSFTALTFTTLFYCFVFHNTLFTDFTFTTLFYCPFLLISLSQHCFTAFTFTTLFYCFHLPLFYCLHFHNIVLLLSLSQHCFTDFTFTTLFYWFLCLVDFVQSVLIRVRQTGSWVKVLKWTASCNILLFFSSKAATNPNKKSLLWQGLLTK